MKNILLSTLALFIGLQGIALADAPHELGGFVLGDPVSKYEDRLRMNSVMPIRHLESLKEIETRELEGYKSGLIYYGTCTNANRIVRIKLKYENPSKKFYYKLLDRFKARFGEPDEWRGDPFHIRLAWKWYFIDDAGNQIGLILQHNTQIEDEKKGNSVKLTHSNLLDQEYACFEQAGIQAEKDRKKKKKEEPDWDNLMPH